MKYGITSDLRLIRGTATNEQDVLISAGTAHYVAQTFDDYSEALSVLMNNYTSWTERNARTHATILAQIRAAIAMNPL